MLIFTGMNESICNKCQSLPKIEEKPFKAILFAEADMMQLKIQNILRTVSTLHVYEEENFLIVEGSSFYSFLRELDNAHFAQNEQEDIQIVLMDTAEPISLGILKRVKSIKNYLNISRYQDVFEILKKGNLITYFQPIVRLADNTIFGYECLLRGRSTDGSMIPPYRILEAANSMDLMFYVDRAARETAVRSASQYHLDNRKVFINFIPTTIYDPAYCLRTTLELSRELGFNSRNLVFEVVESYKVTDLDHLKKILDYYRDQGFKTALDDVGSGFSNLNTLIRLHPDYLKVDMDLIRNIDTDLKKQSVFKALLNVGKEMGTTILAEGIETKGELEYLQSSGTELGQGYFFARPAPEPVFSVRDPAG